ncbi:unnamed protein product [Mytilus coruscus]|uniref:Uncharacterized protein n=1 Tax=Mytilus coruscus TaxID=42192 RepID=A0A6J8BXA0_MYTCO|nr:unnamed protein product [Mytilus coruscus]
MAARFEMKLNVSKIQKDQITKFIEDQDWKDVIAEVKDVPLKRKRKYETARCSFQQLCVSTTIEGEMQQEISASGGGVNEPQGTVGNQGKCPFCLVGPCVIISNSSAPWIGPGQLPSPENSGIRKEIYKRFWKIVDNLGVWYTEEYLDRKKNIGGGEWVVYHRREIMPKCVLDLARSKYPNPKDIPYIGHQWE